MMPRPLLNVGSVERVNPLGLRLLLEGDVVLLLADLSLALDLRSLELTGITTRNVKPRKEGLGRQLQARTRAQKRSPLSQKGKGLVAPLPV